MRNEGRGRGLGCAGGMGLERRNSELGSELHAAGLSSSFEDDNRGWKDLLRHYDRYP